MRIEALTVIPEVFDPYLDASIMGRARRAGVFEFVAHDLRKWTHDRHHTVDDAPFGGGQGMLMKPAPVFEAVDDLSSDGPRPHVVFFSPCGRPYDQRCAERLSFQTCASRPSVFRTDAFPLGVPRARDAPSAPSRRAGKRAFRRDAERAGPKAT